MSNPLFHIAFYHFARLEQVQDALAQLQELTANLRGSILVATEGINGMLAGSGEQLDRFEQQFKSDNFVHGIFAQTIFKRTVCNTTPFHRMKIKARREIVPLGIDGIDAPGRISDIKRADVSPEKWRELIQRDDVVVLDNRNSFEFQLGHFEGAIDPGVTNFRDFPEYVKAHAQQWKQEKKKVAMYCTGGIRCEKSSVWMQDLGLEVYQLEGGILNYFQAMDDAEKDWNGECFVFDNRVALDTRLSETATTVETVYANVPDGKWRLNRAKRLEAAAINDDEKTA